MRARVSSYVCDICASCPLRLAHSSLADYPVPRIDTSHRTSHFTTSHFTPARKNFKAWRADLVTILSHTGLGSCIEQ